jgi:hypothetical protein
VRKSIGFLSLMCLVAAGALAGSAHDDEMLAEARQSQLEFRQGNRQVIGPLVQRLETAVARSPGNADLWQALGHAYMAQQGVLFESSADPVALIAAGKRGRDAYARTLALDKNNVLAQASHGMARMGIATLEQNPSELMAAIEEMNAAVRQAPKSTPVRLTRGFTTIHLPLNMRDTAAVVEDLRFVMDTAPGGRAEDVLHVLLGDVYAETGKLGEARHEYEQVTGASRFAAEQSRARLGDLNKGAVSPAGIALVRAGTGSKCAMCHAPGTDD